MSLAKAKEVWRSSRVRHAGSLWVGGVEHSRIVDGFVRTVGGVIAFLERCGNRVTAVPSSVFRPTAVWCVTCVLTTLLVRGVIVGFVGQEDGRWWVPSGLIMLWGALLVGHLHRTHPEVWQGSRVRRILRRCVR